jgi:5-methylcytosine-specific restriction endonuclease McrA
MNYPAQLKRPEWQRKRLEIFQRDNFKCVNCNATDKELQVHHVEYLPGLRAWDYPKDMLMTVCVDCHGKETTRPKHENALLKALKMRGFTADHLTRFASLIDIDTKFVNRLKEILSKL